MIETEYDPTIKANFLLSLVEFDGGISTGGESGGNVTILGDTLTIDVDQDDVWMDGVE